MTFNGDEKKVRKRKWFERYKRQYDRFLFLTHDRKKTMDCLLAVHDLLNEVKAYNGATAAGYARECIDLVQMDSEIETVRCTAAEELPLLINSLEYDEAKLALERKLKDA